MPATRATPLCQYRYDALDRLTAQGLTDAPPLQRFYCKSRLATEIQGALRQTLFQHGDWLLAQQQQQGVEHATTLLAIDQQRSVLNTLKANHQAQPIAYAPYGHRQATNGWMSLMGFNGERPDPLTGHYLLGNGYRAFNPVLMRFNSPDSLSPFGKGGLNAYAYCSGDPVNKVDTTGHIAQPILLKKTSAGVVNYVLEGHVLTRQKNVSLSQARAAKKEFNKITSQMKLPLKNIVENDFKQRKAYQMLGTEPINLEMIARKKLALSGVSLSSLPIDEFPPTLHYPNQEKLSAQINLLDYVHGDQPRADQAWGNRLFIARHRPVTHTKNGEPITISSEVAEQYNERMLAIRESQKQILNKQRRHIFSQHFQFAS
ncbi:RHS repeat-associated core domain-containing protein [Pseudomonas sp. 11/12A]|uniref:RHS repeat-associated core domain-containing protein n=1 Tax=Pseudomonas sp. 11/12A TaxID=1506582 RepID=UPI0009DF084F|nr:RHS repeat-associated core domain-containing protein [Pseudomonas sp. 11/12A]